MARDSGVTWSPRDGVVESVDAARIVVRRWIDKATTGAVGKKKPDINLVKFQRATRTPA